jgi:purine nucleoside phosphorylase
MLAIVGGTGLYELPGLEITHRSRDTTPFGDPSGEVLRGRLRSNEVLFGCCRTRSTTAPTCLP